MSRDSRSAQLELELEVSQTPRKTQLTVLPGEIWADIFGGEAA